MLLLLKSSCSPIVCNDFWKEFNLPCVAKVNGVEEKQKKT